MIYSLQFSYKGVIECNNLITVITKLICSWLFLSKGKGVGGLFGEVQKSLPSLST